MMMMEPPSFCLAKDKYMCPPPKKNTHACFWLFAGVKKQLCLCTILYPYLKNKRSVLRGFDVLF